MKMFHALMASLLWQSLTYGAIPTYRLGVASIGEEAHQHPSFERILQQSFENMEPGNVSVASLSQAVAPEQLKRESDRARLRSAMDAVAQYLKHPELTTKQAGESRLEQLEALRRSIADVLEWGPLVQEALLLEMAVHWKFREREKMSEKARLALQVFPKISWNLLEKWDLESEAFQPILFEQEVDGIAARSRPICQVEPPKMTGVESLKVNGFAVTEKTLRLMPGARARFTAFLEGKAVESAELRCERQQWVSFEWHAASSKLAGLGTVGRRANLGSLILWDSRSVDLKLYLFTPEVGLDEIPLLKETRLADYSSYRNTPLPIATDAFQALLVKHRKFDAFALDAQGGRSESEVGGYHWYNDWRIWAGAAAVTAIVVGALLLSPGDRVQSRPAGLSIRFP